MGQLRFGTDGVRGRVPDELTADYVARLARAAARVLGSGPWLIGEDTRESSSVLASAFRDGLRAVGAKPEMGNVVPTPALAVAADMLGQPAAMITASHNPWHDNGVKIFAPGGLKISDEIERSIEAALDDEPFAEMTYRGFDMQQAVLSMYVWDYFSDYSDDALEGLRLVLDCANGAMYEAAPQVARRLGAEVIVINAEPNGRNINNQCGTMHPGGLQRAVVEHNADLGLAFDGDGDRVIAVDDLGNVIDGDRMIALAALQLRGQGQLTDHTVVVTVMSNLGFHKAMAAAGIDVVTTAVGDRYVLEALDAGNYAIGGEQSGHIIYRHLATTGDGLLAGLRLAAHVRSSGRSLADLARTVMTSYPQVLLNVKVAHRHPRVEVELADEIAAADATLDGEGRVLVRASGTEPLIRVMVEAPTQQLAQATADDLANVVLTRFG
jgi:phosphoglucosamine mutase